MADYFTVKYEAHTDRLGQSRHFKMSDAPYYNARGAADELARKIRHGVKAEIIPVPADMVAARRSKVFA